MEILAASQIATHPVIEMISALTTSMLSVLIDRRYQRNGYGREALKLAIDFIRTCPCGDAKYCWLSYEPENEVARKLYLSFGFEEKPELCREEEEIPAVLKL